MLTLSHHHMQTLIQNLSFTCLHPFPLLLSSPRSYPIFYHTCQIHPVTLLFFCPLSNAPITSLMLLSSQPTEGCHSLQSLISPLLWILILLRQILLVSLNANTLHLLLETLSLSYPRPRCNGHTLPILFFYP